MATAKHKAATSVTLAPLAEKSPFEQLVASYWKYAAAASVAIVAVVVFSHRQREKELVTRRAAWDRLIETAGMSGFSPTPSATPEAMAALAGDLGGSEVGPWARVLEAQVQLDNRNYGAARSAVEALKREAAAHPTAQGVWRGTDGSNAASAADNMLEAIGDQERWEQAHAALLANPSPTPDAPRLRLKTSAGDITVAVYPDRAPQHVANFIALAAEGYYNGTKFHRIAPNASIEGGDPNSRTEASATWGIGGADKQLPVEISGLSHFAGVLSAAPGADGTKSSGSLFALTCEPQHDWDGTRVVFGQVTEGLEIIRQISNAPLAPNLNDVPAEPVVLVAVEKL